MFWIAFRINHWFVEGWRAWLLLVVLPVVGWLAGLLAIGVKNPKVELALRVCQCVSLGWLWFLVVVRLWDGSIKGLRVKKYFDKRWLKTQGCYLYLMFREAEGSMIVFDVVRWTPDTDGIHLHMARKMWSSHLYQCMKVGPREERRLGLESKLAAALLLDADDKGIFELGDQRLVVLP